MKCRCGCGQPTTKAARNNIKLGHRKGQYKDYIEGHDIDIQIQQASEEGWYKPNTNDGLCMCGCGQRTVIATKTDKYSGYFKGQPKRYLMSHTSQATKNVALARQATGEKYCPRCHKTKSVDLFPLKGTKRNGELRFGYCKPCTAEYTRNIKLKSQYNITIEEYEQILSFQKGVCYICQRPPKIGGNRLSVDHDHKTGLNRGLVCGFCNRCLGWLQDQPERARRAAEYLENPPATQALGEARYGRTGRVTNKRRKRKKKTV